MRKVCIIGCGWLGKSIALALKKQGNELAVTTRSSQGLDQLKALRLDASTLTIGDEAPVHCVQNADIILICVPIRKAIPFESFKRTLASLLNLNPKAHIIFTSSISVYNQDQGIIDENKGRIDLTNLNYQIESFISEHFSSYTILRLGGLIGEDRHPVNHLAGRKNIPNGNAPVNLVHRKDVVNALLKVIDRSSAQSTFNLVHPNHPLKQDYYSEIANKRGLETMTFLSSDKQQKTVSSDKFITHFQFQFKHSIKETV